MKTTDNHCHLAKRELILLALNIAMFLKNDSRLPLIFPDLQTCESKIEVQEAGYIM